MSEIDASIKLDAMRRLYKALETVDVVPVVRCKDCKHHEDEEIGMVYCQRQIGGWVKSDWFCADGEKRDQ